MKKMFFLFILLLCVVYAHSSGEKEIEPLMSGNETGSHKILILVELSTYRFNLAQSIEKELLKDDRLFITIDDLGSFKNYPVDDYTALIVLNAGKMSDVDGKVKELLKESEKKNIIVMTTWGGSHPPQEIDVDSISAASADENIKTMTMKVLALLEKYL